MGKKKKRKINKRKLLSRIFLIVILITALVVIIKIVSNKTEEKVGITVIVNNEDITNSLINKPYITKANDIYLSIEDIRNIFDKNIIYEEKTGKILTTSETKTAAIEVNGTNIQINGANILQKSHILEYGNTFYIPISEISNIYNIESFITQDTAVINSLYKELITIKTTKKTKLKKGTGFFDDTIKKINEDTELIYVQELEDGKWVKVITYEGDIGYIKNKNVTEKVYKRTNMKDENFSDNLGDISNSIEINKTKIKTENIESFDARRNVIEEIISNVISKEKFTVNINLDGVSVEESLLKRFILELLPRLREIGGKAIITNNTILGTDFLLENNLS